MNFVCEASSSLFNWTHQLASRQPEARSGTPPAGPGRACGNTFFPLITVLAGAWLPPRRVATLVPGISGTASASLPVDVAVLEGVQHGPPAQLVLVRVKHGGEHVCKGQSWLVLAPRQEQLRLALASLCLPGSRLISERRASCLVSSFCCRLRSVRAPAGRFPPGHTASWMTCR